MIGAAPQNGPAIRAIRKLRGRTQEEIAAAIGVDQSFLSLLESEQRHATPHVVHAIAAALDVPPDAFWRVAPETAAN